MGRPVQDKAGGRLHGGGSPIITHFPDPRENYTSLAAPLTQALDPALALAHW